ERHQDRFRQADRPGGVRRCKNQRSGHRQRDQEQHRFRSRGAADPLTEARRRPIPTSALPWFRAKILRGNTSILNESIGSPITATVVRINDEYWLESITRKPR